MTDGDNFTVGTLPGVGRVLFASRDIKVITSYCQLLASHHSPGRGAGAAGQGRGGRPRQQDSPRVCGVLHCVEEQGPVYQVWLASVRASVRGWAQSQDRVQCPRQVSAQPQAPLC